MRTIDPTTLPLVLRVDDVVYIRERVAPQPVGRDDDVWVDICPTCAAPVWKCTQPGHEGKTIARIADAVCPRCEGFRHRHPEVFEFVATFAGATRFIQARLQKPASDGMSESGSDT